MWTGKKDWVFLAVVKDTPSKSACKGGGDATKFATTIFESAMKFVIFASDSKVT